VSGRAIRAEHYLHLEDQKARHAKAARRAPKPGQRGSRRWRRHRARVRRAEAAHRRRIQQAQHQGAKQVIAFALRHKVGTLLVGDPTGITRPQRRSGCRTCGCGGGAALTCCKPCRTRPSRPGSRCGWWMSAAAPPPARPAGGASPRPRAESFAARTVDCRGTGIWSVPTTSPPRPAADPRAPACLCWSSTVGPAGCRHGVTDAATSTTSGGVGPAWPRATQTSLLARLGVARRIRDSDPRSGEDQATLPNGQTLPEGAQMLVRVQADSPAGPGAAQNGDVVRQLPPLAPRTAANRLSSIASRPPPRSRSAPWSRVPATLPPARRCSRGASTARRPRLSLPPLVAVVEDAQRQAPTVAPPRPARRRRAAARDGQGEGDPGAVGTDPCGAHRGEHLLRRPVGRQYVVQAVQHRVRAHSWIGPGPRQAVRRATPTAASSDPWLATSPISLATVLPAAPPRP
jgi:hypothetical protein